MVFWVYWFIYRCSRFIPAAFYFKRLFYQIRVYQFIGIVELGVCDKLVDYRYIIYQ